MKRYNKFDIHMILLGIIIPILTFFVSMNATFAYFTATASKQQSSTTTAMVKIKYTDSTATLVNSSTITESTKILPGDTVSINGAVQNAGNTKIYYILEFRVDVQKLGETQATNVHTKYYSLNNSTLKEIYLKDDSTYSSLATTLDANATSSNFDASYKFDFYEFDNSYKNATAIYSFTTHAIQFPNIADATQATTILMKQMELSSFQESDPTVYEVVNGVPLRQVGTVKDTYDANTKTITRNVGKYELTGEETETQMALHSKIYDNGIRTLRLDVMNAVAARSAEVVICSHAQSVLFGDIYSYGKEGVSVHNEEPGHIYLRILDQSLSTLDAWRTYLSNEKQNGNPVTIWCALSTPTTEIIA